jgi:prolipoprotein diacylglyceryltransferase
LVVAAVLGAALGSKLLHQLANPSLWPRYGAEPWLLLSGKTIVGGLLGGWAAVELTKAWLGVKERTGDVYVLPLVIGMILGRVGCFWAGLEDATYGTATALPWGVDFGDGVSRHPTQLYEIAFLALLGAVALWGQKQRALRGQEGDLFRAFILAYLAFRLAVDFLKPYDRSFGLNAIQWACLLVLLLQATEAWRLTARWLRPKVPEPFDPGKALRLRKGIIQP